MPGTLHVIYRWVNSVKFFLGYQNQIKEEKKFSYICILISIFVIHDHILNRGGRTGNSDACSRGLGLPERHRGVNIKSFVNWWADKSACGSPRPCTHKRDAGGVAADA